jgi:hypothetical protein
MTREQERLKWQKKAELCKAYGLIKGITEGIKAFDNYNKQGLISALEEVREILKKHVGEK